MAKRCQVCRGRGKEIIKVWLLHTTGSPVLQGKKFLWQEEGKPLRVNGHESPSCRETRTQASVLSRKGKRAYQYHGVLASFAGRQAIMQRHSFPSRASQAGKAVKRDGTVTQ